MIKEWNKCLQNTSVKPELRIIGSQEVPAKFNALPLVITIIVMQLYLSPWRRKWQPTPVFLSGKSHGQRSLVGYSPWSWKESDMTSLSFSVYIYLLNK